MIFNILLYLTNTTIFLHPQIMFFKSIYFKDVILEDLSERVGIIINNGNFWRIFARNRRKFSLVKDKKMTNQNSYCWFLNMLASIFVFTFLNFLNIMLSRCLVIIWIGKLEILNLMII
jgi:hypothetical protein